MDLANNNIFHETIHAELHRIKLSKNAPPNSLPASQYNYYMDMWRYFEGYYNNNQKKTATAAEHYLMAKHFINPIAGGLREFDDNTHPIDNYRYFAWEDLLNYGKDGNFVTAAELTRLSKLQTIVENDGHLNPCKN